MNTNTPPPTPPSPSDPPPATAPMPEYAPEDAPRDASATTTAWRDPVALAAAVATGLEAAIADRRQALATLDAELRAAKAHAASRHEALRREASQRRLEALGSIERDRAAAIEAARTRHGERLARIDRELAEAQRTARDEAADHGERTRKALEEALWLADSVHESGLERNRLEAEQVRERIAEVRSELERLQMALRAALRRFRQSRPRRPPDEARVRQASEAPDAMTTAIAAAQTHADTIVRLPLGALFAGVVPFLVPLPGALLGASVAAVLHSGSLPQTVVGGAIGGAAILLVQFVAYGLVRRRVRSVCERFDEAVAVVDAAADRLVAETSQRRRSAEEALDRALAAETSAARATYEPLLASIKSRRAERLAQLEGIGPRHRERADAKRHTAIEAAENEAAARTAAAEAIHAQATAAAEAADAAESAARVERRGRSTAAIEATWRSQVESAHADAARLEALAAPRAHAWQEAVWERWVPESAPSLPLWLGRVSLDLAPDGVPWTEEDEAQFPMLRQRPASLPLLLSLPGRSGVLIETHEADRDRGLAALQGMALRILTTLPPGKVRFTLVDPVGLGATFAGFMHLADEDDRIVGERIWTESRHIEQRLADLTEHMETVIQKYLRNEFESIDAYNEQAGEIAEPYRVLVFTDLPVNLSETAAKRLASVLESGARCGVFALMLRDLRRPLPPSITDHELQRRAIVVRSTPGSAGAFRIAEPGLESRPLELDEAPPAELLQRLATTVGRASRTAGRVEVPFETIAPPPGDRWSQRSAGRLAVALGRAGATRLQSMVLGEGTAQHALIAGKTGSGKSTLLHALITNLACWYSPDEVELYLVDFKKGVEFKTYAIHRLPHARAVAVESDREFGLSVLQGLDAELRRRGERFRDAGVQDLKGFRAAHPGEPMPRTLLVVDEFQELFVEDDRVGQEAALLLDRIARQGRAFGIHAVLGSQTLGGAYSLARTTMGQMGVRIALQCSEADASMILSDDNTAARLLSRPGEAIYNDAGGLVEGNSPFQVVWLPEAVRDRILGEIASLANARGFAGREPIVFEGSAPADLARNRPLQAVLAGAAPSGPLLAWVGEPVSIRDPTAAELSRQAGSNLVVVGQQADTSLGILSSALLGLAAQRRQRGLEILLLDGTPADDREAGTIESLLRRLGAAHRSVSQRELAGTLGDLAAEVLRRQESDAAAAPPILLVVHHLQRFRDLRRDEDDYSFGADDAPPKPDRLLGSILREGPAVGVHVVATCDTVGNLQRCIDRNGLREFDWRVAMQMSATDSSTLIDSPAASRLGMHRAYLHSEERGVLEKFRPYPQPQESVVAAFTASPPA